MPLTEEQVRHIIRQELADFSRSDRYTFEKKLQIADGVHVLIGGGTGTKLGTTATQKLGLWGTTPVVQPSAIADVAGAGASVDGTARTAINAILAALRLPGIIKT